MILTGKAKKDFLNYVYGLGLQELLVYDVSYNAMVIEWLDSVGIILEIGVYSQDDNSIVFSYTIYGKKSHETNEHYPTRRQATEAAIKESNEIYNSR